MSRSDIIVELIEAVLSKHGDGVEKAAEELCAQEADKWDSSLADRIERLFYRAQRGNSGDWNSGDDNSGNRNSGFSNSGDRNSGFCNSGSFNSGWSNSGDWNSGDDNSGNRNSGFYNSGDRNSGFYNSGDCNAGDHNAGDYNTASYVVGCFNTESQKLKLSDQETEMTFEQWQESKARRILVTMPFDLVRWVPSKNMTEEEKEAYPEHNTTGGCLRTCDSAEGCVVC